MASWPKTIDGVALSRLQRRLVVILNEVKDLGFLVRSRVVILSNAKDLCQAEHPPLALCVPPLSS